jgi:glycosyltransferase involved in cell wall biosynthesis
LHLIINRKASHRYSSLSERINIIGVFESNAALRLACNQFLIPWLVRKHGIDILYCPADISPLFVPCKLVVGLMHQFIYFPEIARQVLPKRMLIRSAIQRIIAKVSLMKADRIVSLSEATKEKAIQNLHIEPEKIKVIYPGLGIISDMQFTSNNRMQRNDVSKELILTVSRLSPHKNIETLIRSYAMLTPDTRRKHNLVIVGECDSDYKERLRGLTVDYDIDDCVLFLGGVPSDVILSLLERSILFVFPSLLEGFGLPPLEAMKVGVPVISSNAPAMPEVLGDAVSYFNPRDAHGLYNIMVDLLEDAQLRNDLINKGAIVADRYSWHKTASELSRIFEDLSC